MNDPQVEFRKISSKYNMVLNITSSFAIRRFS